MTATERVLAHLRTNHDRILGELVEFASIPSVSTDPAHAADMLTAAQWVAAKLKAAGPIAVRTIATPGNPVVYGEWLGAPGKLTVLVYGHYDVQPADPLDKWHSAPFTPTVRDGRLYARGVSDDKGPMLIPIKVAESFFATAGALPGKANGRGSGPARKWHVSQAECASPRDAASLIWWHLKQPRMRGI